MTKNEKVALKRNLQKKFDTAKTLAERAEIAAGAQAFGITLSTAKVDARDASVDGMDNEIADSPNSKTDKKEAESTLHVLAKKATKAGLAALNKAAQRAIRKKLPIERTPGR